MSTAVIQENKKSHHKMAAYDCFDVSLFSYTNNRNIHIYDEDFCGKHDIWYFIDGI